MSHAAIREQTAVEVLQNPEKFKSLPIRKEFDRQFCIWRLPSFQVYSSWALYRVDRGREFVVRRLEYDRNKDLSLVSIDPDIYASEAVIEPLAAKELILSFERIELPLLCGSSFVGLDGTMFGLKIGNPWQEATIKWWSHHCEEWSQLSSAFDYAVLVFESKLPLSTLREVAP